jgi:hypothetical protein
MTLYYAGIGSRETPKDICTKMTTIAQSLCEAGYILRSGGAIGADSAFEAGAGERKEIYYTRGYRVNGGSLRPYSSDAWNRASHYFRTYHPTPHKCSDKAVPLLTRNTFQLFGADFATTVCFVICWTPDGSLNGAERTSGGTGQALRISVAYNIPVFNLARLGEIERFVEWISCR